MKIHLTPGTENIYFVASGENLKRNDSINSYVNQGTENIVVTLGSITPGILPGTLPEFQHQYAADRRQDTKTPERMEPHI